MFSTGWYHTHRSQVRCRTAHLTCQAVPSALYALLSVQANPWRGAGLAMPVFSLRTDASLGVGEFSDLRLVVDFAVATGLRLVQLLPVNDTSVNGMWWDSYPYR